MVIECALAAREANKFCDSKWFDACLAVESRFFIGLIFRNDIIGRFADALGLTQTECDRQSLVRQNKSPISIFDILI
jgi:hypothetical protein